MTQDSLAAALREYRSLEPVTDFTDMTDEEVDRYIGRRDIEMGGNPFGARWITDPDLAHWDLVRHENGKAVAIVSRNLDDNEPAELERLYVLPDARGAGIGKDFIHQLATNYGQLRGEYAADFRADFFEAAGCKVNRERSVFFLPKV